MNLNNTENKLPDNPIYNCNIYPIIDKKAISNNIYSYEIYCPEIANKALPGQFVHVKAEGFTLRRPISICGINLVKGTIRIVFEIRGAGTKKLSLLNENDSIDMIAPLGNGFTLPQEIPANKKIILVGGGIGVPPLLEIAVRYKEKAVAILGFRSYDRIILRDDFINTGAEVIICTDDGSAGEKSTVTLPLEKQLALNNTAGVYSCGPAPMLKSVSELTKKSGVPCQVSLEERMGCGVGACVCCACKITRGNKQYNLRVCKDGPVFNADEVIY